VGLAARLAARSRPPPSRRRQRATLTLQHVEVAPNKVQAGLANALAHPGRDNHDIAVLRDVVLARPAHRHVLGEGSPVLEVEGLAHNLVVRDVHEGELRAKALADNREGDGHADLRGTEASPGR